MNNRGSKMSHKCDKSGCYLKRHICDFDKHKGWYGDCRPSDIDYVVERNGNILIQEWKEPDAPFGYGQQLMYKYWAGANRSLGYQKFTIMQVEGYSGRMDVVRFRFYKWETSFKQVTKSIDNIWGEWRSPEQYEHDCRKWYELADSNWFWDNRRSGNVG